MLQDGTVEGVWLSEEAVSQKSVQSINPFARGLTSGVARVYALSGSARLPVSPIVHPL